MTAAIYMSLLASLRESLCRILPSILFAGTNSGERCIIYARIYMCHYIFHVNCYLITDGELRSELRSSPM